MTFPILTAKQSNNAELFAEILELYVPDGSLIADVTWGNGAFWKDGVLWERMDYLVASDLTSSRADLLADFRHLPYRDETFDAVVFDPPYGQGSTSPRKGSLAKCYNLGVVPHINGTKDLYKTGIWECHKVLKDRGILIVKVQDMVNNGKQHRISYLVYQLCVQNYDMEDLDQFVVVQKNTPIMRHKHQVHARKNHSFFWVFRKR